MTDKPLSEAYRKRVRISVAHLGSNLDGLIRGTITRIDSEYVGIELDNGVIIYIPSDMVERYNLFDDYAFGREGCQ